MIFHVVQQSENLEDILNIYEVTIDDLKEHNQHISNIKQIIPGMKLRIPNTSIDSINEIEEVTPFIEDYYPSYEDSFTNKISESSSEKNSLFQKELKSENSEYMQKTHDFKNQTLDSNYTLNADTKSQMEYGYYTYYGLPPYNYLNNEYNKRNENSNQYYQQSFCTNTKISFDEYIMKVAPDVYYEFFIKKTTNFQNPLEK